MTYDHRASEIHRADLDREIESIRNERLMSSGGGTATGVAGRARQAAGRVLIWVGTALLGREAAALTTRRA